VLGFGRFKAVVTLTAAFFIVTIAKRKIYIWLNKNLDYPKNRVKGGWFCVFSTTRLPNGLA